ncbi:MAG: hypothetical protein ACK526_19135 [Planctomyces sp.]
MREPDEGDYAAMILIAVLIVLFSAWMLWGWFVGENHDITWMRTWCAVIFVVTGLLISTGAGAGVTLALSRSRHRAEVRQFAESLEKLMSEGRVAEAHRQLRKVVERPDEWSDDSNDLLERMAASTEDMKQAKPSSGTKVAEGSRKRAQ